MDELDEDLLTAVRSTWAAAAGVDPGAFSSRLRVTPAPHGSTAPPGWCGALVVGDRALVTAPSGPAAASLERALADAEVLDADQLRPAVAARTLPGVCEVLGPASLSYRTPAAAPPSSSSSSSSSWVVEAADPADDAWRGELAGACSAAEVAESLLERLGHVHLAREDGAVVAAAGWEEWPGGVAHVGVLAAPAARGRGAATAVAGAAVRAAARAGLLVQWRAVPEPSRRLARRAGLVEVGWQLSWRWSG